MKFRVQVMPRPEALDPQGRAVQSALEQMGFSIKDCRVGKSILIETSEEDPKKSRTEIAEMIQKLLVNPLIEIFEMETI